MPSEAAATRARIRLDATMDLGMSFQVMLTHKCVSAVHAAILSIPEMRLNMGFNILFSPKASVAVGIGAHPPTVERVRATDICCDFFGTDAGVFHCSIDIEVRYRLRSRVQA
jgi:hypothetical protein